VQLNRALPLDVLICVFGTSHEKVMRRSHLVHGNRYSSLSLTHA
jgi:hypothetical protein